jgi:hypothetical protein
MSLRDKAYQHQTWSIKMKELNSVEMNAVSGAGFFQDIYVSLTGDQLDPGFNFVDSSPPADPNISASPIMISSDSNIFAVTGEAIKAGLANMPIFGFFFKNLLGC